MSQKPPLLRHRATLVGGLGAAAVVALTLTVVVPAFADEPDTTLPIVVVEPVEKGPAIPAEGEQGDGLAVHPAGYLAGDGSYEGIEYSDAYPGEPEPEPDWEPLPWDIDRGPNWTDRVLLTYDDCMNDPDRFIEILDHATANDIGLLIFPTGNCVIMYRNLWDLDLLALIRERGHWVGNHSLSHPHMTRVSANELNRQLAGGAESNVFRPPFGDWNRRVLDAAQAQGMYLMMWDLDTDDWRGRTEQDVVDVVVNYAQPGYSVLMHLQHQGFSVGALDAIQAGLQERGLRLCRPAPLELRPTPVELPGNIC